jgi:transcriptional regulator with XRE-family HTH domain
MPPLRAIREGQGLTLRYVADSAGLDVGHLSRIERGQAGLSIESLARLAKVLGMRDLSRRLEPFRVREEGGP